MYKFLIECCFLEVSSTFYRASSKIYLPTKVIAGILIELPVKAMLRDA